MERFQGVIFNKSEKKRSKNKKEQDEKVRILHFYWSENLNLSQYQLSKHFSKIFFGSRDMTKIFGLKEGKKWQRTRVLSKNYL